MDLKLAGKTVIVTGGGSNIGRSIALAFGTEGSNVVLADLDERQGVRVADEIMGAKGRALAVKTDVTDPASVARMVDITLKSFGRIDVLVNNVGWTRDLLFMEKTREEWEKEVKLNFWSVVNCTRAVLDHFIAQKNGVVVSMGSDAGRMGEFREAVYGAMKGGVIALSKALARENGRYGIRFNVVCPGMTLPASQEHVSAGSMWNTKEGGVGAWVISDADVIERVKKGYPLRRIGRPEDIANAVVFLASDAASFITGQTLSVSGGYTMM
ncbi:MAG: glucose 1-dehydrogenase [Dehalococcoidia bacterium]|nr:glucose 1-dehydrogenase [Dehalococcoidia bacterium]